MQTNDLRSISEPFLSVPSTYTRPDLKRFLQTKAREQKAVRSGRNKSGDPIVLDDGREATGVIMKSAVSIDNCQRSRPYCVRWRRAGAADRFRHWVLADSIDEAVRRSRLDITKALGTNASLWKIEEPEKHITAPIATEVVRWRERPRGSSHRVRIVASVLLSLCLLFLFYWENNPAWRALLERITK
jgi:hypothetical protein